MWFRKKLSMYAKACMKEEGVKASVLLGREYSRWFEVAAGLRQVCLLSPVL